MNHVVPIHCLHPKRAQISARRKLGRRRERRRARPDVPSERYGGLGSSAPRRDRLLRRLGPRTSHRDPGTVLRRAGNRSGPTVGVFAQRTRTVPTGILLTTSPIDSISDRSITVRGLDGMTHARARHQTVSSLDACRAVNYASPRGASSWREILSADSRQMNEYEYGGEFGSLPS